MISIDLVIRIRFSRSFAVHALSAVLSVVNFILSLSLLKRFKFLAEDYANLAFYVCSGVLAPLLMAFGAYSAEWNVRVLHGQFWSTRDKLESIQNRATESKASNMTELEHLMAKMKNILSINESMQNIEATTNEVLFQYRDAVDDTVELQKECIAILSSNRNLYTLDAATLRHHSVDIPWLDTTAPSLNNPSASKRAARANATDLYLVRDALRAFSREKTVAIDLSAEPAVSTLASGLALSLRNSIGVNWCINMFALDEKSKGNALPVVGWTLLRPVLDRQTCPDSTLYRFLHALKQRYINNQYHNQIHGAQVAHHMMCMMDIMDLRGALDDTEVAGICIAALGHDVGHPGRNNNFFVNSGDSLALVYNDHSVLENYHAFITFDTMADADCNVLGLVPGPAYRSVRKIIIDLILATDIDQHFSALSAFRVRRQAPDFDYRMLANENEECTNDKWMVAKMCIKVSDIGHPSLHWEQHSEWANRVIKEFYSQGDEERQLQLAVTPMCDRKNFADTAKSQYGFIEIIYEPLLLELGRTRAGADVPTGTVPPEPIAKQVTDLLTTAASNRDEWKRRAEAPAGAA
eukprot:Polyplicarium_translucidae@DN2637_c0_g1_i5.p1